MSLVGICWRFDDELGNFLRGSHGGNLLLFLKSLLDDLRYRHVVNFLTSGDLSCGDGTFLRLTIKDYLVLGIGLHLCLKKR